MKARSIKNRLIAFMMSFVMVTGQAMPVMASGNEDEVNTVDAVEEEEQDKEVIEMPAELFNLSIVDEEGNALPALNEEDTDDIIVYDIDEDGNIIADTGRELYSASGYSLGGLEAESSAIANPVDEGISYKTIMSSVVDGADFQALEGVNPGAATVSAAFPFSSSETAKIKAYFDEKYPICRDQNPYGTCWAHSTLAACEFNLIAHNKADKNIDTSELALSYWTSYQGTAGPAGDNGNTVKRRYAKSKDENFLQSGGNSITAAQTLFQQRGITAESDVPYSNAAKVLESEKIDPKLERKDVYYVTEYQEYELETNPTLVKEGIIENGGLSIAFCWYDDCYNKTYNSYYMDKEVSLNHFVTVVGWDDNFPKDHFVGGVNKTKPKKDGAWLIRNSWNSNSSKAEMDYTDYFWLSYEDMSVINVAGFKAVPASEYEYANAYYYDTQVYAPKWYTSSSSAANVYKASVCESGEILSGVTFSMFELKSSGTKYTIDVYKNVKDGKDPSTGTKVSEATTTGTLYLGGTYTVSLNSPVKLDADENFAIVVTRDDNKSVALATDFNWNGWNLISDMKALPGQSWLKDGGTWKDTQSAGNFIIHALTKNAGAYIKIDPKSLKLAEGAEASLSAEAYDASNKLVSSATFTWASDNTEVATVDSKGNVKAVGTGTATITATYNGIKGKCTVTVGADGVTSVNVNYGDFMVNGVSMPLTATVAFANTVSYKARKINVKNDLSADIGSSGLYNIAKALSTTGNVTKDVITWKYTAKKNKNANSGSYFYVQAKVAKKSVTTAQGITGKNLKQLKKAVSAFNKAAKKKDNRISFTITPLNAFEMLNDEMMVAVVNRDRFTGAFKSFSHFRARLEPDKQPAYSSSLNYKKWTKISNKEFKKVKENYNTYTFTPKNKNVTGPAFRYQFK